MKHRGGKSVLSRIVLLASCALWLVAWGPFASPGQNMTQPSLSSSQGVPVKPPPGVNYVGQQVCAECHANKAKSQKATAMAKALQSAADCDILRSHSRLTFRSG